MAFCDILIKGKNNALTPALRGKNQMRECEPIGYTVLDI